MTRGWLLLPCLVACSGPPDSGTSIGNPNLTYLRAAPGTGVDIAEANALVDEVVLMPCDTTVEPWVVEIDQEIDLLSGAGVELLGIDDFEELGGDQQFCSVSIGTPDGIEVEGTGTEGGTFEIFVDSPELMLNGRSGLTLSGSLLAEVAAPGWIDAEELGIEAGADVVIDDTTSDHASLLQAIEIDSRLFLDDGDGVLSASERAASPVAAPEADDLPSDTGESDDDDDDSPGCAHSSAPTGAGAMWLMALLLLLTAARTEPSGSRT